ncbi:hypothetical protein [Actinomadura sp. 3N407]|uniref:hypothetical protein n=1 Tax=Actinomadura sp. 3N407 TaxID=3457423 RepID=UPI003FCCDE1D
MDGVPRWVVLAAYAASLTPLPSAVWRIALGLGAPLGPPWHGEVDDTGPLGMPALLYMVILSVVSEGLAFLTVGLVSQWGEVVPRWVPLLGRRRVPTLAAVIPACLGAIVLTVGLMMGLSSFNDFRLPDGTIAHLDGWRFVVFNLAYRPLLAWGPLLGIVAVAYYLRRTRPHSTAD